MRLLFLGIVCLFLFTQCNSNPFKTTCYEVVRERGGRTTQISFTVTSDGNQAHGSQSTLVTDANGMTVANAVGTFKGTCLNGICLVDYTYESEGQQRVAEEEFKLEEGKMLLTASSYRNDDGKEMMKERGLFNVTLNEIACPE